MDIESIAAPWMWAAFTGLILGFLALDLLVFHRKAHEVPIREALGWSGFWIAVALAFNALIWFQFGASKGLEFLTGYLLEKSLSVDNLFVFLVVFSYFGTPAYLQHRVLFWGILGALVLRVVFIVVGAALLNRFHWFVFVFGGFLVFTGIRLFFQKDEEFDPQRNLALRLFRRVVPAVETYHGARFFVRDAGRWFATPLALVLIVIEASDVVFAVDSIPAIFAVTRDPFIVYTSNIFAILGLRALFFLLAGVLRKLVYLHHGLSAILVFVGLKMLLAEIWPIPIEVSLLVVAGLLAITVLASIWKTRSGLPPGTSRSAESVRDGTPE